MHKLLCLAAGLLLGAPSSALAGVVGIEFDLSGSTLELLGGAITIPPDGSITAGSMTVRANADGLESLEAGALFLKFMGFDLTIDGNVGGGAHITGALDANQPGTAFGTLNGALSQALFPGSLILNVTGPVDCSGTGCGFFGSFPMILNGPNTFTSVGTFGVANLNLSGSAILTGSLSFTIGGITAAMSLVGNEVNRTFLVPEPGSSGLVALGLVALAGGGWLRARRQLR